MINKESRIRLLVLILVLAAVLCVNAASATEIGIRYGRTNIQGSDLFKGMDDLGGTHLLPPVAEHPLVDKMTQEILASYHGR